MSQRRTIVPPTHESSRVVASRTVRADCKGNTEKQSAKRRTVLDYRFHRTDPGFSRAVRDVMMAQLARQRRSGPRRLQPRVRRLVQIADLRFERFGDDDA